MFFNGLYLILIRLNLVSQYGWTQGGPYLSPKGSDSGKTITYRTEKENEETLKKLSILNPIKGEQITDQNYLSKILKYWAQK